MKDEKQINVYVEIGNNLSGLLDTAMRYNADGYNAVNNVDIPHINVVKLVEIVLNHEYAMAELNQGKS